MKQLGQVALLLVALLVSYIGVSYVFEYFSERGYEVATIAVRIAGFAALLSVISATIVLTKEFRKKKPEE